MHAISSGCGCENSLRNIFAPLPTSAAAASGPFCISLQIETGGKNPFPAVQDQRAGFPSGTVQSVFHGIHQRITHGVRLAVVEMEDGNGIHLFVVHGQVTRK